MERLSVCLVKIKKSTYFTIQLIFATIYVPLYFLVLFIDPIVLFKLIFICIYNTFSKKNLVLAK